MELSSLTPISGIQTHITRHDVSANDIANISTQGYSQRRVVQADVSPAGVKIAAINPVANQPAYPSNTDLAEETGEQIVNKHAVAANVKVLKVQDRMVGEILDMVG